MLNYQLHCFNRKVITTKIQKDLDLHTASKPKWCHLLQPEICNCTETGCLHARKLNMQNIQKPITCKWQKVHTFHVMLLSGAEIILSDNSHYWVVLTSFYLTSCIVEWCPHILSKNPCCRGVHTSFYPSNHAAGLWWHNFIPQLMLLGCADILPDNSNCWVVRTSFYPINHADGLWWHNFIWQFASKFILMFCALAGSIILPTIPMCHQSAHTHVDSSVYCS